MNIEGMEELLKQKKYEEFVKQFPEDRKPRIELASILAAIVEISQKKEVILREDSIFSRGGKPQLSLNIAESEDKERKYLIVRFVMEIIVNNKDRTKHWARFPYTFIVGKDDSGFWVECVYMHSRIFIDDPEVDEGIINAFLNAGITAKEGEDYFSSSNEAFVRLQGDINLHKVSRRLTEVKSYEKLLLTRIFHVLSEYIESVDKFSSAINYARTISTEEIPAPADFSTRYGLPIFRESVYGDRENSEKAYKSFIEKLRLEIKYLDDCYKDMLIARDGKSFILNFENHSIELYGTSYLLVSENFISSTNGRYSPTFMVIDKGRIILKSPHHKTVDVELGRGIYVISKSGGLSIDGVDMIMKYLPDYVLVGNVYKKVDKKEVK